MPTTDTSIKQFETVHLDQSSQTTTNPSTPATPHPRPPRTVGDPAREKTGPVRIGVAFAIASVIAVGTLVWTVIASPADSAVDMSTYDRVEANRADTLRDLSSWSADSYDRVEANRADTLRDLSTRSADSYDRVEANRADTLRDLSTRSA